MYIYWKKGITFFLRTVSKCVFCGGGALFFCSVLFFVPSFRAKWRIMLYWEFALVPKTSSRGAPEMKMWCAWIFALWSTQPRSCRLSEEAFVRSWDSSLNISYRLKSGLSGWLNVGKHSGPPHFLSETRVPREERRGEEKKRSSCHLYVSSMGHPGKLLSSQVVAIQWYLLQGRVLVFAKRYRRLYLSWNSERVCTCGAGEEKRRRVPESIWMFLHSERKYLLLFLFFNYYYC